MAQDIRRKLLERLNHTVERFPIDATEVRQQKDGKTLVYKLTDLTRAYRDLTDERARNTGESAALDKAREILGGVPSGID